MAVRPFWGNDIERFRVTDRSKQMTSDDIKTKLIPEEDNKLSSELKQYM